MYLPQAPLLWPACEVGSSPAAHLVQKCTGGGSGPSPGGEGCRGKAPAGLLAEVSFCRSLGCFGPLTVPGYVLDDEGVLG